MNTVNRKSKDSVFVRLFQDKENILQLYKELHPEVTDVTVDDIEIQTLESLIVNKQYNDLGFTVKDKWVMLFEAQSTWNPNMPVRMLSYLNETFINYIRDTEQSVHMTQKVKLPFPELWIIYSGEEERPSVVSFNDEFFDGKAPIDLKIKVLRETNSTLAGQYIGFCRVFNEQRKKYNNSIEAAKETYRICIKAGYLAKFMEKHEQEVIDMMAELFDEKYQREQYDRAARRINYEAGKNEGLMEALKKMIDNGIEESEAKKILGLT
ncbi:MAG: hypothetical protein NC340_06965 [Ruminococcus flavefaciens]|nr:hypothetical protein [Ruminococcus flavefaciens]MCM1230404.1 hypothetical protein [Ruminococcus flavefaciens]